MQYNNDKPLCFDVSCWSESIIETCEFGAKMVSRIRTMAFTLSHNEVFCKKCNPLLGETIQLFESTWLTYLFFFVLIWIPGLVRNHSPGTVLHFFHTYLYILLFDVLTYFSSFSAIQNKTFLRIGASPRLGQHKELLVHEEEDSRHLGERIKFEGISGIILNYE